MLSLAYGYVFLYELHMEHTLTWYTYIQRRCCPCQPCSARRYRNRAISDYQAFSRLQRSSEYDTKLPHLMSAINQQPIAWTPGIFPHLWSRIMILDEHLQQAKPWSIWVLFRNRNDTLQFWTFL